MEEVSWFVFGCSALNWFSKRSADILLSDLLRTRMFLVAFLLCVLVWVVDPLVDTVVLGHGSFLQQLFYPSAKALTLRVFFTCVILLCAFTLRVLILGYQRKNRQLAEQRAMVQRIVDSEPECVKTVGRDGRLLDMNPAGLRIIEADSKQQVQFGNVYDLIAEEDRQAYIEFNNRVFQGESGTMEYDVIGLKGSRKRVETHAVPLLDEDGRVSAHLAVTRDISAFRKSQEALKRFSVAVEQCASVVMITDTQARITYVNPRFTHVTGFSAEEALGSTPGILRSGKQTDEFYRNLWNTILAGREWRGKMQNQRKSGELYWAMAVISPLKDETGQITHYLCTQEDVTSSELLTEQLDYQARHCMLTGLVNRYEFEQRLHALMRSVVQAPAEHAVFFLDLDQFKVINDTCGHLAGDQLLRQISALIQRQVRKQDLVSRSGGDEFAVLMEHCPQAEAARIAEKLRAAIEDSTFGWGENIFRITVSVGVVSLDEHSTSVADVLSKADTSCYMAKELGRNRVYIYRDDETSQRRLDEAQWVARIHEGIEKNRFCLYVQDIEGLQEEHRHYEVLIRYRGGDGELVPPGAFLPPAERFGLSPKLDRWVIHHVCEFLAARREQSPLAPPLQLSINLSGPSIADDDLLQFVRDALQKYQIDPQQLCFEITETAAITHLSNAIFFIREMKEIGCRFALDDFGSGLSSFGYLKTLPVDFVKIDGIFVKDILEDEVDLAMVRSINDIGHLMGKKTIAEFVENQKIADVLRNVGVDYAQGYGISRPRSIDELMAQGRENRGVEQVSEEADQGTSPTPM